MPFLFFYIIAASKVTSYPVCALHIYEMREQKPNTGITLFFFEDVSRGIVHLQCGTKSPSSNQALITLLVGHAY